MAGLFAERRPFPGQDPWVIRFEDTFLLIQSTSGNRKISVKCFTDLDRMHRFDETVIWDPPDGSDHARQVWAPELHHLDGHWYVYYAASDGRTRNHRMYALEADHPLGPYREMGKVFDPLHDTWAIDMTVLQHEGGLYAVWSGWSDESEGGLQNLYIAPMSDPWTLSGERRLISRPEHGWEISAGAVNEGPEILRNPAGRLFIVYSADASWTPAYKMGLLEWIGGDVTDPASWSKLARPIFRGGGHGCFIDTAEGSFAIYHRKRSFDPGWADREIRVEPLTWDPDGYPVIGEPETTHPTAKRPPQLRRSTVGFPSGSR
jgi:GH43 family beta-xylosidase